MGTVLYHMIPVCHRSSVVGDEMNYADSEDAELKKISA